MGIRVGGALLTPPRFLGLTRRLGGKGAMTEKNGSRRLRPLRQRLSNDATSSDVFTSRRAVYHSPAISPIPGHRPILGHVDHPTRTTGSVNDRRWGSPLPRSDGASLCEDGRMVGGAEGSHFVVRTPAPADALDGRMPYLEVDDFRAVIALHLGGDRHFTGTTDLR